MNVYIDTCAGEKSQSGNLDENICPRGENIGHSDVWFWIDMVHKWMGLEDYFGPITVVVFCLPYQNGLTPKMQIGIIDNGRGRRYTENG